MSPAFDDIRNPVPQGEAPGDDARAEASVLVMSKRGPTKLAVYEDADTDRWIEAHADSVVEVPR